MFSRIALCVLGLVMATSALACRVNSDCGANGSCVRANASDTYGQCVTLPAGEPSGDTPAPPGETPPTQPRTPTTPRAPDAEPTASGSTAPASGQPAPAGFPPQPSPPMTPGVQPESGTATDGVVLPLPPGVTDGRPGAGEGGMQPRVAPRPPRDDNARWDRLNELMAIPGAQPGDDDAPEGDGDAGNDDDEGSDSDPLSGSWYDPREDGEGFATPGSDSNGDAQRPTIEELMEPYLRPAGPETLRTPCEDCEVIAQETRARISEFNATRERRYKAARERVDSVNALVEAERTVRHIQGRVEHYDNEIQRVQGELEWERSKVRNEDRVREVESELRRLERLRTDTAAELPDAERAVRDAQQAFDEAEASEFGFLRREERLRGEIADLLKELWDCEREKCGIIRDVDYDDDGAQSGDGAPDDADAAREIGRILDDARDDAPDGNDD